MGAEEHVAMRFLLRFSRRGLAIRTPTSPRKEGLG